MVVLTISQNNESSAIIFNTDDAAKSWILKHRFDGDKEEMNNSYDKTLCDNSDVECWLDQTRNNPMAYMLFTSPDMNGCSFYENSDDVVSDEDTIDTLTNNFLDIIDEICANNDDVDECVSALENLDGTLKFDDESIDDGIDDEDCPDEYLMKSVYTLTAPFGKSFTIRLYFGNNTRELTEYTVQED